ASHRKPKSGFSPSTLCRGLSFHARSEDSAQATAATRRRVMAKKTTDDLFEKSTMTFGEHLEELRVCLFRGVVGVTVGCLVGFFIANQVVRFFQSPLEGAMEEYYLDKALADYKTNHQVEAPVEVKRMVLEQGLVPEVFQ